jgi:hypothetical protein
VRAALAAALALALLAGAAAGWLLRGPGGSASVGVLERRLDEESAARVRLEEQLAQLQSDVLALRLGAEVVSESDVAPYLGAGEAEPGDAADESEHAAIAAAAAEGGSPGHGWFDPKRLAAAGLPERDVEDLRRLFEEVELERLHLQNQATRERWDRARLAQELAALDDRTRAVRDTYGDETYDWFLYAADRSNRVVVESVLGGSAADEAGLRAGDVILSYDGQRIFKPGALVRGTLEGRLDENVDLRVQSRGGGTRTLTLPRGPLGIRLGRDTVQPTPLR